MNQCQHKVTISGDICEQHTVLKAIQFTVLVQTPLAKGLHLLADRIATTAWAAFSPRLRQVSSKARARLVTVGNEVIVS